MLGVFFATLMGFTLLNPVHLLLINLITDCFPALALGMEKAEDNVMHRPPRKSTDGIFAGGLASTWPTRGAGHRHHPGLLFIGHYMEVGVWEMPHGVRRTA